jgi:predicted transcriptional regulator
MNKLAILVDEYINSKGIKYNFISDKLGISRQALYQLLRKKNFNVDDANRILAVIGYKIDYDIKPL